MTHFFSLKTCYLLIFVFLSVPSYSQWTNGIAADLVYGQSSFTTSVMGTGLDQLNQPAHVFVSPVTGKVFVSDHFNHRLLRYGSYTAYSAGQSAELKLATRSGLSINYPYGIYIDQSDRLWLADRNNSRVLRFDNCSNMLASAAPSLVLGQPNFTTYSTGSTLNKMAGPHSVFLDESTGTLWVSDTSNQRILRFDNIEQKTNGASADGYLGTGNAAISQNSFDWPMQIYVDKNGGLWVADYNNNRVLRFRNARTLANSANADILLGQSAFNRKEIGSNSQRTYQPIGVYGDGGGRIYVSERGNNRIVVYQKSNLPDNVYAPPSTFVIGQLNYGPSGQATTEDGLNRPAMLFVNDRLWVADFFNNRVLSYAALAPLPVGLSFFKAENVDGKLVVSWETLNENNNAHFEIQVSADGEYFKELVKVKSKAENGNSLTALNYRVDFNIKEIFGKISLAGFGLLGCLVLPVIGKRRRWLLISSLLIFTFLSCEKQEEAENKEINTLYVKLMQVDKDGTAKVLGLKAVKR